jgi:hypothetical protein
MTNINITGQYKVNGVPLVLGSNPKVIALSATNGTVITGTTSLAISRSLLIPANTITGESVLEFMARYQKVGTTGGNSCTVYVNTSPTLTGASLVATFSSSIGPTLVQGIRNVRINTSNLHTLNPASGTFNDYASFITSESVVSFNASVDNYLLFCVQNGAVGDSNVVQMARVVKYE